MWFNNVLMYRCTFGDNLELEDNLAKGLLKPCPPHSRFNYGWLANSQGNMVLTSDKIHLITMGKNEKILPRTVINQALEEKIKAIEFNQDRAIKRAEKAQLKEDIEFELLPKAFSITKHYTALIDEKNQMLYVNSSSQNQTAQLLSLLRKSIEGLTIEPLGIATDLSVLFTQWVNNPNLLPKHYSLAPDCVLYSPQDEKKKFNCKGYELPADEVCNLIKQGLVVRELSFLWNDRIQFTLNTEFTLKRVKCLDYLLDDMHEISKLDDSEEQLEASLVLLGGELRSLSNDLMSLIEKNETKEKLIHVDAA